MTKKIEVDCGCVTSPRRGIVRGRGGGGGGVVKTIFEVLAKRCVFIAALK